MSRIKVIAFYMHEDELDAAQKALSHQTKTDSYVYGEIDEADIPALEIKGVIVQRAVAPKASPPDRGWQRRIECRRSPSACISPGSSWIPAGRRSISPGVDRLATSVPIG